MTDYDPKNSQLREATTDSFYKTANLIHGAFPKLTANQLTMGRAIASIIATEGIVRATTPRDRIIGCIGYTAFELADGVDGHLANIRAEEHNVPTNLRGNLYDTLSDKTVETYDCFRAAGRSIQQNDKFGATINILAGITSPLPALFRAKAEANNLVVKESGLGTRPVRSSLIGFNLALGENKTTSRVLGASILAMNIHTATSRFMATRNDESKQLLGPLDNERKQLEAKLRYPALVVFSVAAVGVGAKLLRKNFSQ
jgi:phosphatidylglycerophosphate synthase